MKATLRRLIGAHGLQGARLAEAWTGDLDQLRVRIVAKLREAWKIAADTDPWPWVRSLFADHIVVEKDGKLYRYAYTVTDTDVALGAPTEVKVDYVPVDAGAKPGAFIEAQGAGEGDGAPTRWLIRIIRAGWSANGTFYSDAVLREAAPLFEGARVLERSDGDHIAGAGKSFGNLIGRLTGVRFVEGKGADTGELQGTLDLLTSTGDTPVKIKEACDRGMADLFGFSVDVLGSAKQGTAQGRAGRIATKFAKVNSVDLIVEPGAGGGVIRLAEARQANEDIMDRKKLIRLIESRRPDLRSRITDEMTDEALEALFVEAMAPPPPAGGPASATEETLRLVEARLHARTAIAASPLPEKAKARLVKRFVEASVAQPFTIAEVDAAIAEEREYLAGFTESGHVQGLAPSLSVVAGETRAQKVERMLDAFFDPTHQDHAHARSFKECYIEITGDRLVTGMTRNADRVRLTEALNSASFDDVLGSSITRRMIADFRQVTVYDSWRRIASVVPVGDFRSQERVRFGGYGDLPVVAQQGAYLELDSPTDEKATYAVSKRGGTEAITLEMIKNDDVGAIQRIPTKLSRAAKRTLGKFVWDFIRTNPTIYDSVALFHASRGNLGAAALDATALAARRLAMLKQTELNSADRLGIPPRFIAVPFDLEFTAKDLFVRNTNLDATAQQSLALEVLPVWYWTDGNDWALIADPADIPGLEVGFLDGKEEPELFVQDNPTVGSMFSNDTLTWKIRFIFGGVIVDYRPFDKSVVA